MTALEYAVLLGYSRILCNFRSSRSRSNRAEGHGAEEYVALDRVSVRLGVGSW